MALLSVVIPTHRRPDILRQCLKHLTRQTIASELDIVVVSDGEDPATQVIADASWGVRLRYVEIKKSHQGVARNTGTRLAIADRLLFIGDDIFLAPDACARHVHSSASALLGFTTWDPACGITPVMRWLETSGWQFGYPSIRRYAGKALPSSLQHRYSYTSHISLPRDIALSHPFREDLQLYGWEDIEWGMRLAAAGVPLLYDPEAKALHHHHLELEDSLRRMQTLGASARVLAKTLPSFDRMPKGWKLFCYRLIALLPTMRGRHVRGFVGRFSD